MAACQVAKMSAEKILELVSSKSKKGRKWLAVLLIIITVHGLVGFMMFIFEEAMQTAMFAAFAYQNAKDWHGLKRHIKVMKDIHSSAEVSIYSVGWLAPLMFPAYLKYLDSNEAYIKSVEARVAAELK